jgi:4'-phosphopantetheinyl transferase
MEGKLFMLDDCNCKVYAVNIEQFYSSGYSIQYLLQFVSENRKTKLTRFRRREDLLRSLIGELIIRSQTVNYLNIPNCRIEIENEKYGKPYINGYPNFHFNISHSGQWVICAISKEPVGIDIEKMDFDKTDLAVAERFFTDSEKNYIFEAAEREEQYNRFYEIWTLKESYIKCLGVGLRKPLDSYSIEKTDFGFEISNKHESTDYRIFNFKTIKDYCFSLTCKDFVSPLIPEILKISEMVSNF